MQLYRILVEDTNGNWFYAMTVFTSKDVAKTNAKKWYGARTWHIVLSEVEICC